MCTHMHFCGCFYFLDPTLKPRVDSTSNTSTNNKKDYSYPYQRNHFMVFAITA